MGRMKGNNNKRPRVPKPPRKSTADLLKAAQQAREERSDTDSDEEELHFEKRPRRWQQEEPVFDPNNGDDNGVGELEETNAEEREEEEEKQANNSDENKELSPQAALRKAHKALKERNQRRVTLKERIAALALAAMEDPQNNYKKIGELCQLCQDEDVDIIKLALVSAAALFSDLIPAYRIREASEQEADDQKSMKNYGKTRDFELSLLSCYKKYLTFLNQAIQGKLVKESRFCDVDMKVVHGTRLIAVRQLAFLLATHSHFNYSTNIMVTLAPMVESKSMPIRKAATEAFHKVLENDVTGDQTLELVRVVSNEVKKRNHCSGENVLSLLLEVRLREDLLNDRALRESVKKKKKKKKKDQIELEMAHSEAVHRREEVVVKHQDILDMMFVTFVRILKKAPGSPLMPTVLKGISKFGHSVNVTLLEDMISHISTLLFDVDLPLETRLQSFLTIDQLRQGDGNALVVDGKQAHVFLYEVLGDLPQITSSQATLLFSALSCLIRDKKNVPFGRMAAITKRSVTGAMEQPPHVALALLAFFQSVLDVFPKIRQLLENEATTSAYDPLSSDPDFANGDGATLWELTLLSQSHHPFLASAAKSLMGALQVTVPGVPQFNVAMAGEMCSAFDASRGVFAPPVQLPPKHTQKKRFEKLFGTKDSKHLPRLIKCPDLIVVQPATPVGEHVLGRYAKDQTNK